MLDGRHEPLLSIGGLPNKNVETVSLYISKGEWLFVGRSSTDPHIAEVL